jgi:hypothetical protein
VLAQRRADVVDGPPGAGLQDDRRLPTRQRYGHPQRVSPLRRFVPPAQAVLAGCVRAVRWLRPGCAGRRSS